MTHTFVSQFDLSLAKKLQDDLIEQGFEITKPLHTQFSAKKKHLICTLYNSGKLTVQGKDMADFLEFYLEPNFLPHLPYTSKKMADIEAPSKDKTHIGIDESGKGDFFGPLCVAGVYAKEDEIAELRQMGIKDSKLVSDSKALKMGKEIRSRFQHQIVKINPPKYNEIYRQFKNLNSLLAWAHSTVIEHLVKQTQCHEIIIDQFAAEHVVLTALKRKKLEISIEQRHRAEEDLVVAAASILARATFLEELRALSDQYGIILPKGASKETIEAGILFVRKYGEEMLTQVGKLHFKTKILILQNRN